MACQSCKCLNYRDWGLVLLAMVFGIAHMVFEIALDDGTVFAGWEAGAPCKAGWEAGTP